jgi:uncharacterized membrane protein YqjE
MNIPFMNPLLRLIATQPNLIVKHLESYARMFGAEVSSSTAAIKRRVFVGGAALLFMLMGLIFAGVGLMLWAGLPQVRPETSWLLLAVPGLPLGLSLLFFILLKSDSRPVAMNKLKAQVKADVALLHETGAL